LGQGRRPDDEGWNAPAPAHTFHPRNGLNTMSALGLFSFFGIMLVLAAIPSSSVALVVARAVSGGFRCGVAAAAGIALADVVFVLVVALGMNAIAERMAALFSLLRVAGGCYLIALGMGLWRTRPAGETAPATRPTGGRWSSFAAGFALTLGDIKALFFYASLFPALLNPAALDRAHLAMLAVLTFLAVGGVKLAYAAAAERMAARLASRRAAPGLARAAGVLLAGIGLFVALTAW